MVNSVPSLPRFSGKFFQFEKEYLNDRHNSVSFRFLVYSSGSQEKLFRLLWCKLVWDSLTREECELFLTSKISEKDYVQEFIKNLQNSPKKLLRKRLLKHSFLLDWVPTRDYYRGLRRIHYEIHRITRRLGKTKKYSGYVRNISSIGSKSPSNQWLDWSTEPDPSYFENKINIWSTIFTVGVLPLPGEVTFPLNDESNKIRNGIPLL